MRQTGTAPVIKYAGIAETLRAQIKRGDYSDCLPSRRGLARLFHVDLKTMDKALVILRKEHVVLACNGVGLFVHPRLKGQKVSECFLVFPGHKALADPANDTRFWLALILEQLLSAAHDQHVELRLLPISPLNNNEISWTLLQHLKKGDYALFLGTQYWKVIRELSKRGCRCLMLGENPAVYGLAAEGLSLMSVNIDHFAMLQTLADYFLRHRCRHPAMVFANRWHNRRFLSPVLKRLTLLCRRNGMPLSVLNEIGQTLSDDELADGLGKLLGETPPVDAIFTPNDVNACRIRHLLDERFPARRSAIRLIGYSRGYGPQGGDLKIDWLDKPYAEMIRHLLQVVCGALPFKPGFLPFPTVLEQAEDRSRTADGGRQTLDRRKSENDDSLPCDLSVVA